MQFLKRKNYFKPVQHKKSYKPHFKLCKMKSKFNFFLFTHSLNTTSLFFLFSFTIITSFAHLSSEHHYGCHEPSKETAGELDKQNGHAAFDTLTWPDLPDTQFKSSDTSGLIWVDTTSASWSRVAHVVHVDDGCPDVVCRCKNCGSTRGYHWQSFPGYVKTIKKVFI